METKYIKTIGLEQVTENDLIFTNEIEDDRVNTTLLLNDYDWASYTLSTRMKTKQNGELRVVWNYVLMATTMMYVEQVKDNEYYLHKIIINSNLFAKYLCKFMEQHMKQWESENTYAFCGEDVIIEFFNECIQSAIAYKRGHKPFDKPQENFKFHWNIHDDENCYQLDKSFVTMEIDQDTRMEEENTNKD